MKARRRLLEDPTKLALMMKGIKKVLDPNGILNSGC
jgi:FAD/FMN-containing dehydrogenase